MVLLRTAAQVLPFSDGCADVVFMSMVYHHFFDLSLWRRNAVVFVAARPAFATAGARPPFLIGISFQQ
jgi:hypothetical protein